ncbi:MAG: type IX secretion system outer membrane channel protein PorV [Saprospiraceae bacterium]|nr:type IX secretion system outer membrane channel protein PorV [Saprospiraceae bacterium]
MSIHLKLVFTVVAAVISFSVQAQWWDPVKNCVANVNGECVPNTVLSTLPFLRITPDARSGAMGDVGVALKPDAHSMHFNASTLAFSEEKSGIGVTYTPWLTNFNLDDIFLAYISGYYKLNKNQAVGGSIRYFSLGDIQFTDEMGTLLDVGRPREIEGAIFYTRKLGDNFSASLTGKYIYSNLATGQNVRGVDIVSARSYGADLGLNYRKKVTLSGYKGEWSLGLAITNIGSKVSYTANAPVREYIPTNLGLGTALTLDFDKYNSMTFALDINKLMVPTPIARQQFDENGSPETNPECDKDGDGICDFLQQSLFEAMLGSFSDAQGGFREELQEYTFGLGVEYWYDKQFAARLGYYYENPLKGNRRFFTVGAGIKYNIFGINLSYLVPTSNIPNPLDNTLRFSLLFDFSIFQAETVEE